VTTLPHQEPGGTIAPVEARIAELERECAALRESEARLRSALEVLPAGVWYRCLQEALQRLRYHAENSPLGVVERSADLRITAWNAAAERMFGWAADEVLGKRIDELQLVYPDDREGVRALLQDLVSGARPRNVNANRNVRKDAGVIHCEWYNSALHDASGKLVSVLSLVMDVTARKRAEEAARASEQRATTRAAELQIVLERKDEFLGMLSHELRNPLGPIRNSIHVLKHAEPGGDRARRAKEVVERQTEHLTRLVDDLLDVTRIARGKIELRRSRVDLREVVAGAADDFRHLAEERGVALRMAVPDGPLWADADGMRITQVVGNLLHNATKFTRREGEVTLALRAVDGQAELRVRDTGAGIAPDLLPHVFDPFVQGERTLARTEGGLGLGLALVKGIVELHGGTVRAQSAGEGRGAELLVRLPLAPAAGRDVPASPDPGRRVLVVDDNRDAADSLAQLVRMLGHAAEVAYDGPSALEKARANPPDVVLCDIGLPGLSGYEVARALRAERVAIRLVAITGYARADDVRLAVEAGFDAHVPKPCDPGDIGRLLG
jgi:PAS domain S-box-containing protein